jgi:hypothetical protein
MDDFDFSIATYMFECSCGERFLKVTHAQRCKKCRQGYSLGSRCLYVTDLQKIAAGASPEDALVWGRYPTADEQAEYTEEMRRQEEEDLAWIALMERT